MLPVPALSTIPGASGKAATKAISMSVVTCTRSATCSFVSALRTSLRSGSRPAPAAPTTIASAVSSPAAASAFRVTSAMVLAEVRARPGRTAAPGPLALPRISVALPTTAVVRVPPTFTPTKMPFITPSGRGLGAGEGS